MRAANDGNAPVPTVVVAGQPHTNPDPEMGARTALPFPPRGGSAVGRDGVLVFGLDEAFAREGTEQRVPVGPPH